MSETPTNGAVSPEASVETMSFGSPIGSVRIPAVIDRGAAAAADPDDPADIVPCRNEPAKAPRPSTATAAPRSLPPSGRRRHSDGVPQPRVRVISGAIVGCSRADVDDQRRPAERSDALAQELEFLALGVGCADDVDPLQAAAPPSPAGACSRFGRLHSTIILCTARTAIAKRFEICVSFWHGRLISWGGG